MTKGLSETFDSDLEGSQSLPAKAGHQPEASLVRQRVTVT